MIAAFLSVLLAGASPVTRVRIDDAEARAALSILQSESKGRRPSDVQWKALFATEGYRRLKQREAEFKHPFTDDDFRVFLGDPKMVARTPQLQTALNAWAKKDLSEMEARARAYLPADAASRATVCVLIKPRTNSFVYQLETNPAIMLYLDPKMTPDQFSNTVSHELLHAGDSENCPPPDVAKAEQVFTPQQKTFAEWLSAFGEGWAVLAAAGGPDVDPHWEDPQHDRDLWNAQMARFQPDFADLQAFFTAIARGSLQGDAVTTRGMSYFGDYQGPWYTVGYKMDVTIEHEFGRAALVNALCDKRGYLRLYNAAAQKQNETAGTTLPLWNAELVHFLGA